MIALCACGGETPAASKASAAPPSPAPAAAAAPVEPPSGWRDAERIDATIVATPTEGFAVRCPTLDGPVVLVTLQGLRHARGIPDTPSEFTYQLDRLTPGFLRKLAVPADSSPLAFARAADPALWAVLEKAQHVAVLVMAAHRPATILDANGHEVLMSVDRVAKARPGSMDGWLFVVERATGSPLCHVKARVTHAPGILSTRGALQVEALDDWLRRTLITTLAAKLAKAAKATLVDETGPVIASDTYRVDGGSADQ